MLRPAQSRAFTLIELLVVVTIIVVLLALLTPALDKAVYQAQKLQCLSRQRVVVQACIFYATDHKKLFPPNKLPGRGAGTSYDVRTYTDEQDVYTPLPTANVQLGILPEPSAGYLPPGQLARLFHCTNLDNLSNPGGIGPLTFAGTGMDVIHSWGMGASWYNDPDPAKKVNRIIIGYNYRAASWERAGKGLLRMGKIGSDTLITVDMPDSRFVGSRRQYTHPDGYGRAFADAHASFQDDTDFESADRILARQGGTMDGTTYNAAVSEDVYENVLNKR